MSLERLAFDHLVAKLEAQRSDIRNLRNQASISAAITGLIGTVFATALDKTHEDAPWAGDFLAGFSLPAALLFIVFSGSIAFSVMVVVHWRDFTFSFDSNKMLDLIGNHQTPESFLSAYVRDGEWFFRDNEKKIETAQAKLWWAMVLGWLQILPWLLMI